jgi:hypothetical protein
MKRQFFYIGLGLFLLPIFVAGLFILIVRIQTLSRYDQAYFTAQYQERYRSPGLVAAAIEQALHSDDRSIFAELTGLRAKIRPPEANPDIRLMIVLKVTDAGYFQYLFFNTQNYQRIVYNIKKVDGRWVFVPRDAYYFLDSGDWLLLFTPLLIVWWGLLAVTSLGIGILYLAARFREQLYGISKS